MYQKAAKGWLKHFDFLIVDAASLQIALFLADLGYGDGQDLAVYGILVINFLLVQLVTVLFREPYKNILKRGYFQEFIEVGKQMLWTVLIAVVYFREIQGIQHYPGAVFAAVWMLATVIGYPARLWRKRYLKEHGVSGQGKRSLLIVTETGMLDEIVQKLIKNGYSRYHKISFVVLDKSMSGQWVDGVPVVADSSTVETYVCRNWVDEVFVNLSGKTPLTERLMNSLTRMGMTVHVNIEALYHPEGRKQQVERLGEYTVVTTSLNVISLKKLFLKRVLDILGGLTGCLITLLLMVIIGPMIYLQSPGNIFFSQIRVGKNGKKFRMYKFRSMYLDAEERKKELMEKNRIQNGLMFKLDDDPRIIGGKNGIGSFIRRYSLDEFPQFWNVLKGDMSLVGTRPPTVDEWEKYDLHHRTRLAVRPGITGMWQISGRSEIIDFEEVVRLDQTYIEEWSFGLDIKILLKTVLTVAGKKSGAM